ncbi:uncharacterized protein LOC114748714 [Neltuma alba]|uniref:uncharacterized protein LOC114748714 n=1 Tax=Neltuma alba TaxID=207710 RepID=UPI0010A59F80|nr:uncharacterized protein LOC114748714 [Prosopis alba]
MANHHGPRHNNGSGGDSFSFPSTPNQDSCAGDDVDDFEFGSLTPDSPSSDPSRASPADHIFFNGRLLPHSFPPLQPHPTILLYDHNSRAVSRTSSKNSRSMVLSSRSNSTNSRSSSCSSARTSSSDSSERRLFYSRVSSSGGRPCQGNNKMAYGCSQRWQYITPVPATALSRDSSLRRKGKKEDFVNKKKKREDQRFPFGRRLFRWIVMACKECHALEPSRKERIKLRENVK